MPKNILKKALLLSGSVLNAFCMPALPVHGQSECTVQTVSEDPETGSLLIQEATVLDKEQNPVAIGQKVSVDYEDLIAQLQPGTMTALKGGLFQDEQDGQYGIVQITFEIAGLPEQARQPVNVLLILDQSGSMNMYSSVGNAATLPCLNEDHVYFIPEGAFGNHGSGYVRLSDWTDSIKGFIDWSGTTEQGTYVMDWVVEMLDSLGPMQLPTIYSARSMEEESLVQEQSAETVLELDGTLQADASLMVMEEDTETLSTEPLALEAAQSPESQSEPAETLPSSSIPQETAVTYEPSVQSVSVQEQEAVAAEPVYETITEWQLVESEPVVTEETVEQVVEQEPYFDEELQEWITPDPLVEEVTVVTLTTPEPVWQEVETIVEILPEPQAAQETLLVCESQSADESETLQIVNFEEPAVTGSEQTSSVHETQESQSIQEVEIQEPSESLSLLMAEPATQAEWVDDDPHHIYDSGYTIDYSALYYWSPTENHYALIDGEYVKVETPAYDGTDASLWPADKMTYYSDSADNPYGCTDRMLLSKAYAREFIDQLLSISPNSRIALELFANGNLSTNFTNDMAELEDLLNMTIGGRTTNYQTAFIKAQSLVTSATSGMIEDAPLYILFVSDGKPENSRLQAADVDPSEYEGQYENLYFYAGALANQNLKDARPDAQIYTIGLMTDMDSYLQSLASDPSLSVRCDTMEEFASTLDKIQGEILYKYPDNAVLSDTIASGFTLLIDESHPLQMDAGSWTSAAALPETLSVSDRQVRADFGLMDDAKHTLSFFIQADPELLLNQTSKAALPTNESAQLIYTPALLDENGGLIQGDPVILDIPTPYVCFEASRISGIKSTDKDGQTVHPKDQIRYIITLINEGLIDVDNVYVNDLVPEGTRYVSGGLLADQTVYMETGPLAAGSQAQTEFIVEVSKDSGVVVNSAAFFLEEDGPEGVTNEVSNPAEPEEEIVPIPEPEQPDPTPASPDPVPVQPAQDPAPSASTAWNSQKSLYSATAVSSLLVLTMLLLERKKTAKTKSF